MAPDENTAPDGTAAETAPGDGTPAEALEPRATIYDVATAAGVSPSTVSRAFSRPGRVSDRTAARIHQVADELGYRRTEVFRPDRPSKTRMIGLTVSDVTNPFYFNIIRGAEQSAAAAGYSVILLDAQESPELEQETLDRVLPTLDALVMATTRISDTALRGLAKKVPTVVLNRWVSGLHCLLPDNARGMRLALEHLGELGHRRVSYVAGPEASWANGVRWRSFRDTCLQLGLDEHRLGPVLPTGHGGAGIADRVTDHGETAVICYNDLVAIGLLRGLARRGLRVPQQVSVMGFDNIFVSDLTTPTLTTVAAPTRQLGERGVQLALALSGSRASAQHEPVVLPVQLVVRESTGRPPT